MSEPRLELIPARTAVCSDGAIALDVLVRITPSEPEVRAARVPLNLALVLDRSGSMSEGKKMPYAREAAAFVVQHLLPEDRVSVTTFDDRVETIVPNAPASDKASIVRQIESIRPRNTTNLHGGWAEGGRQAESHPLKGGLNRVLVLSDGLTNAGITEPNAIAAEVRGLAARGVSTTTLGVGADYNEDLMEAMARAGDGHYYYIESPVQLADIFQGELRGLLATSGQKVSLGLEPDGGATISDVLNDFEKVATGRLKLPNLVAGLPVQVVVRLMVPAQSGPARPLAVRLAWDDPRDGGRHILHGKLDILPALTMAQWSDLPVHPDVREQEALLMVARAQKEASVAYERGDLAGSAMYRANARGYLAAVPPSASTIGEMHALDAIEANLDAGNDQTAWKMAKFRSYSRKQGRIAPEPPPVPPTAAAPEPPSTDPNPS